MPDFLSFLDPFRQEWPVIAGAPFSFAAAVLAVCAVVYAVVRWHFNGLLDQKDEQLKTKNERLEAKEEEIANLKKGRQELTEQLQNATTKLNEYIRAHGHGFHPTLDRVADGLIAFSKIMRKVPIKIAATSEAHPFAEQLAAALTSMNYGVLPHEEQTHGIVPARSPHDKIIVRYEEKVTNPVHNSVCEGMITALNYFITCEVSTFPPNGGRDYLQIELLGEP